MEVGWRLTVAFTVKVQHDAIGPDLRARRMAQFSLNWDILSTNYSRPHVGGDCQLLNRHAGAGVRIKNVAQVFVLFNMAQRDDNHKSKYRVGPPTL